MKTGMLVVSCALAIPTIASRRPLARKLHRPIMFRKSQDRPEIIGARFDPSSTDPKLTACGRHQRRKLY
jgi:hypothetical protein